MSSIDDLSLISGISSISRISRANSTSVYKCDSTCNLSEWQSIDSKRLPKAAKLNKTFSLCEEKICDYAKFKLIYECLNEIVTSDNHTINKNTKEALKKLITIHKVKKHLHLPSNSKDLKDELTLLGIIDLQKPEFSYVEQLAIKSCLDTKVREKVYNFVKIYENSIGSTREVLKNNESKLKSQFHQKGELENLHWIDKIDEVCIEYKRNLQHCFKLLMQWKELRSEMSRKKTRDAEALLLQAKLAEMKARITKLNCTLRMYKETPVTINAFKILNTTLDEKIAGVSEEVAEKIELKKAYEALNNTEYSEILRKYLELCHVVKKKRTLLEEL